MFCLALFMAWQRAEWPFFATNEQLCHDETFASKGQFAVWFCLLSIDNAVYERTRKVRYIISPGLTTWADMLRPFRACYAAFSLFVSRYYLTASPFFVRQTRYRCL